MDRGHVLLVWRLFYRRLCLQDLCVNQLERGSKISLLEKLEKWLLSRQKRSRTVGGKRQQLETEYHHHTCASKFSFNKLERESIQPD